ncbi:hypothetical protein FJTKL_09671 [Diaporthe vaccinii]|uniref:Secreted protein n=1 Tax=Diaporthe vaccinii TaxID=105482 RepID=A0ABR4ENB0_9PEZI
MKPNIVGLALWTSSTWCLRDCFCMKATPSSQRTQKLFFFLHLWMEYTGMQGDGMSASMPDDNVRPTTMSGDHVDEAQGVCRRTGPFVLSSDEQRDEILHVRRGIHNTASLAIIIRILSSHDAYGRV